jgi:N-acetylglucosamine kinase-like BadF-type ATPase
MTGLIAVDAGQTGMRLRFTGPQGSLETSTPGILTDRPLMPQLAAVITDFCAANYFHPTEVGVGSTGLVSVEATELLGLLADLGVTKVAVAHDATTSYLGALGDRPGVVIAAGTGVVTMAVGASEVARVDGWGYLLGDAGSGYWVGRAGMVAAMRAFDGRGESTTLLDRFRTLFPDPTTAYVDLQADDRRVSRVAAFSKQVDQAAARGDGVATRILAECAAELSDSVLTGLRRVGLMTSDPPPICGLGKVLSSPRIMAHFVSYLRLEWRSLELTPPAGTSLDGAALAVSVPASSPLSKLVAVATI